MSSSLSARTAKVADNASSWPEAGDPFEQTSWQPRAHRSVNSNPRILLECDDQIAVRLFASVYQNRREVALVVPNNVPNPSPALLDLSSPIHFLILCLLPK